MDSDAVESLMDRGWALIQQHRNLLEGQAYSHAFLTERQYERLVPTEWHNLFSTTTVEEIAHMAAGHVPVSAPQSLRDFIVGAHECRLGKAVPCAESAEWSGAEQPKAKGWRQGAGPKKLGVVTSLGAPSETGLRA